MTPLALEASLWGLAGGGALVVGALIGYFMRVPQRVIAAVMAFGSGVLISALAFELMDEAYAQGGFAAAAGGFLAGAAVFTGANIVLARFGARDRKRSGGQAGTGAAAIAIGSLIDGVPESIAIGVSLLDGTGVSLVTVAAIVISNVPEGLSSAAGMRASGRGPVFVLGLWTLIAAASAAAAWAGYAVFADFPPVWIAAALAMAAGAILAMIADTMIPEAFETAHDYAGLITVAGFLTAFGLSKLAG